MAYVVDVPRLARLARSALYKVTGRITVLVDGGIDYTAAFQWAKGPEFYWAWPHALITEVTSEALRSAGVEPGVPILWVDGLDTAILSDAQLEKLLKTRGRHTLRIDPPPRDGPAGERRWLRSAGRGGSCHSGGLGQRCRTRSPYRDLGTVATASGSRAFNTSWAGIEVTEAESRRREAREQRFVDSAEVERRDVVFRREARQLKERSSALALREGVASLVVVDTPQICDAVVPGADECNSSGGTGYKHHAVGQASTVIDLRGDKTHQPLVGTCRVVVKRYRRLTDTPQAAEVRPLEVLRGAVERLQHLQGSGDTEGAEAAVEQAECEGGPTGWDYIGDQLRAVRQDLLVQGLHDPRLSVEGAEFTARVYGLNILWALGAKDLGQFLQCAAPLRGLLQTMRSIGLPFDENLELELFVCRLLHATVAGHTVEQRETLEEAMATALCVQSVPPLLRWAREVAQAYRLGNSVRYFRIRRAPSLCGVNGPEATIGELLLRIHDDHVRLEALRRLCSARTAPGLALPVAGVVTKHLGFKMDAEGLAAACQWCSGLGGVVALLEDGVNGPRLDCRQTLNALRRGGADTVLPQPSPRAITAQDGPAKEAEPTKQLSATAAAAMRARLRGKARKLSRALAPQKPAADDEYDEENKRYTPPMPETLAPKAEPLVVSERRPTELAAEGDSDDKDLAAEP